MQDEEQPCCANHVSDLQTKSHLPFITSSPTSQHFRGPVSLHGCKWGVVLQFCQRVRLRVKYKFATCIHTCFGKKAESNNFKIKEGKAIHRQILHLCTWGRGGVWVAAHNAPGQQQGRRESSTQPCRNTVAGAGVSQAPCSSDPNHPPNHSSFPSLTLHWNISIAWVNQMSPQISSWRAINMKNLGRGYAQLSCELYSICTAPHCSLKHE